MKGGIKQCLKVGDGEEQSGEMRLKADIRQCETPIHLINL